MNENSIYKFSQILSLYLEKLGNNQCAEALKKTCQQTGYSIVPAAEYSAAQKKNHLLKIVYNFTQQLIEILEDSPDSFSLYQSQRQLANAISQATTYSVTVNYDIPLENLIGSGNFNCLNKNITAINFPAAHRGIKKFDLQVIEMIRSKSINNCLLELWHLNLMPADIYQLLALCSQHPELIIVNPVAALAFTWKDPNSQFLIPYASETDTQRRLDLEESRKLLPKDWRIAAYLKTEQ